MPKVHNEQNPNRLYDHETCIYSNTYCSKWYKKRTSCQNDGKLVPGNLSYLLSGFCNVTCLRGKFEDECRVDRALTLIRCSYTTSTSSHTSSQPRERQARRGAQGWIKHYIYPKYPHFVYKSALFMPVAFVCLVVMFEAKETAASR